MNFKTTSFWITLAVTYLYVSILNGLGHWLIISPFLGPAMTAINADPTQFRIYFLMMTWLVITLGTVYFTVRYIPKEDKIRHAVIAGALVSIIADGTWVFTNTAFVPALTVPFVLVEMSWHTIHGALGGVLALKTYEWAGKRFSK